MPMASSRRSAILLLLGCIVFSLFVFTEWPSSSKYSGRLSSLGRTAGGSSSDEGMSGLGVTHDILKGDVVMPKLGNETAKAELGRAAWKLFHTTFARFPQEPTQDQKETLKIWTHLFQRMYPCGECATHFRKIIDRFPPQVSSRNAAAAWGCHVHNEVNRSLKKPVFDCANIGDFYDCGCADDDSDSKKTNKGQNKTNNEKKSSAVLYDDQDKPEMIPEQVEKLTGSSGRAFDLSVFEKTEP